METNNNSHAPDFVEAFKGKKGLLAIFNRFDLRINKFEKNMLMTIVIFSMGIEEDESGNNKDKVVIDPKIVVKNIQDFTNVGSQNIMISRLWDKISQLDSDAQASLFQSLANFYLRNKKWVNEVLNKLES